MKLDKELGMEMPENEEERMWFNLREKLKMEIDQLEEAIKPKNRKKNLERTKMLIKINKELIKKCNSHLQSRKGGKRK